MHLVIGASGQLGSRVSRRLLARGEPVRAVSRRPPKLAGLVAAGAEALRGDLREDGWLPTALQGVRTVVLSSQGLFPPSWKNHPERADEAGSRRVIDAAVGAGVNHVVLVSVGMEEAGRSVLWCELKYRIEKHLEASGLAHSIVRPTVFAETHALALLAEPLRRNGKVQLFGRARTPLNWISTEDAADYIVHLIHGARASGDAPTIHRIGGPDVLSRLEALELVERLLGRKAKRNHVPPSVLRAMRRIIGPVHPGMRYVLDLVIAEEENPAYEAWNPSELDWTGPTTVERVVKRWLAETEAGIASTQGEGAPARGPAASPEHQARRQGS